MIFDKDGNFQKRELDNILKTYNLSTGMNISVLDTKGEVVMHEGVENTFCDLYNELSHRCCNCAHNHLNACMQSVHIGEPYFYFCDLNFMHITIPLLYHSDFAGGITVGPIIIRTEDISFEIEDMLASFVGTEHYTRLNEALTRIQTADPIKVNYLGNMLYMMVSKEIEYYHKAMKTRNKKMYLQAKLNEQIQYYKKYSNNNRQIHELENRLFAKVKAANHTEARTVLNELLALIVYEEGNDIKVIRARAMEICSLLSRAAIDGGANEKKMLAFNYTLFSDLDKLNNLEDISFWMYKVLDYYVSNTVVIKNDNNSDIIRKAMTYINNHYRENLTIDRVAQYVHLNHSYFSTLFKKETGQTFSEYLLKNRIEESKLLLSNSTMGILDISLSVGLSSQSYFTKVFKKSTGLTPNQYRNKHSMNY